MVLKPASATPLTAILLGEICRDAGIPDGVVNVITGPAEIGEVLAAVQPSLIGAVVLNDIGPVIEMDGLARIAGYVGRVPAPEELGRRGPHRPRPDPARLSQYDE